MARSPSSAKTADMARAIKGSGFGIGDARRLRTARKWVNPCSKPCGSRHGTRPVPRIAYAGPYCHPPAGIAPGQPARGPLGYARVLGVIVFGTTHAIRDGPWPK